MDELAYLPYSFLDVIVFSHLQRCTIWPKIYKESRRQNFKGDKLENLVSWYKSFFEEFKDYLVIEFNESIVLKKRVKQMRQKHLKQKLNPELIEAVNLSNYEKVKILLDEGADIEQTDPVTERKLAHIACFQGDLKMCKLLDLYGVNWESFDADEQTPIYMAINASSLECVKYLVEEKKVNHEHLEYQNRTPFYLACFLGNIDIVKYIYQLGVDQNTVSKLDRCSLSKAAYLGHVKVVKFLLDQPETVIDIVDSKGRTALHNAVWGKEGGRYGKQAAVGLKQAFKCPKSVRRYEGEKIPDSPECCEMLLQKGHNVNFEDFDGNTPLASATSSDAIDSIKVLMRYGATVNHVNKQNETPLYLAAYFGHVNVIKLLTEEYGADIFIRKQKPQWYNALDISFLEDNSDCFKYLLVQFLQKDPNQILINNFTQNLTVYEKSRFKKFDHKPDNLDYLFKTLKEWKFVYKEDLMELLGFMFKLDEQYFQYFYNYFRPAISQSIYNQFMEKLLSSCDINIFQRLQNLEKEYFACFDLNTSQVFNLIKQNIKNMTEKQLEYLILELSSDILRHSDNKTNSNIIHLLIEFRHIKLLTIIIQSVQNNNFQGQNIYLQKEKIITKDKLKDLFLQKNQNQLTPIDISLIHKYLDIYTLSINFLSQFKNLQEHQLIPKNNNFTQHFSQYYIPNYKIDIKYLKNGYQYSHKERVEELINDPTSSLSRFYEQISEYELDFYSNKLKQCQNNKKQILVEKESQLQDLKQNIANYCIFGIDLEYYLDDSKNNIGFVCTLQISTVDTDYIVDTIKLHQLIYKYLWEFFISETKIKIVHGGDNDLKWLKNNFDIDVMNLFDTNKGQQALQDKQQASFSLAQIAQEYLNIEMDKSFQTSDWRIRPLPQLMIDYAKNDADVLVWVFPLMKAKLSTQNLLKTVAQQCSAMTIKKKELKYRPYEISVSVNEE